MKNLDFLSVCFLNFLSTIYAIETTTSGCLEKEKALALLETADDLLSKAKIYLPSCKEDISSTNQSECSEKKSLVYIEISKKLISEVKRHFPTCSKITAQIDEPTDCTGILASGRNESGIYTIWPREPHTTGRKLQVYCDMETDKGGWTMIQRRGKYSVQEDFQRDWEDYKIGFGNITEEFWLGNENIRALCHKECEIRFHLQDKDGEKIATVYQNFSLSGSNYTLHISNFTGDGGDAMEYHNNFDFSTKDRDFIGEVKTQKGGWWYGKYYASNLNGIYKPGKEDKESVFWWNWRKFENLASVEIAVRPK